MPDLIRLYMAIWLTITATALVVAIRRPRSLSIFNRAYWTFLLAPWKAAMFAFAFAGIVIMAPLTKDPTWDYWDASIMATLTYATAPWSIATLYRRLARLESGYRASFVAIVLWLFSAAWSYDGYLFLRDGKYPVTWAWNLVVSSSLYFLAGLFWNLDWTERRGVHFAFQRRTWPLPSSAPFRRIALWCLPLAVAVALMFAAIGLGWIA
jgi:hypothetical protein